MACTDRSRSMPPRPNSPCPKFAAPSGRPDSIAAMARATSLAFLTPVWQRFSLTEICLLQRRHACDYLKEHHGLDATCIVIGSDENLEIAESFGFIGQHHENLAVAAHVNRGEPYVCLGMKFNAGYGRAYEEGIDLVFPIGSDSWIDPIYFSELPEPGGLFLPP